MIRRWSRLRFDAGGTQDGPASDRPEVIFVHQGSLAVEAAGSSIRLGAGDTMTVPRHLPHRYVSDTGATAFVVRGT